jgi:hypothetical protein
LDALFLKHYTSLKLRKQDLEAKNVKLGYQCLNNSFEDLMAQYKTRKYRIPDLSLKHNLFNPSPLLIEDHQLVKARVPINFKISKNTRFLNKLKKHADDILLEKIDGNNYEDLEKIKSKEEKAYERSASKALSNQIKNLKSNIYITKKTMHDLSQEKETDEQEIVTLDENNRSRNVAFVNLPTVETLNTTTDRVLSPAIVKRKFTNDYSKTKPIRLEGLGLNRSPSKLMPLLKTSDNERRKTHKDIEPENHLFKHSKNRQERQLDKLYSDINLSDLDSIDQNGIIDYFNNYHNYDKIVSLTSNDNLDATRLYDSIKDYKNIVRGVNFNELNKNYFHIKDNKIARNAENVL